MLRTLKILSVTALLAFAGGAAMSQPFFGGPYGPRPYARGYPPGPGFRCEAGPRPIICDLADPPRPLGSPCACMAPFPGRPRLPGRVIR